MALVVTPGATDADSYATVAEADSWHTAMGNVAWTGDDAAKEQALRRAAIWMDAEYFSLYSGAPSSSTQALEWPRSGVSYRGLDVSDTVVPAQIKRAQMEAALLEIITPGGLISEPETQQSVIREKIDVIEVQYSDPVGVAASSAVRSVSAHLAGFISAASTSFFGNTVRI